jgi:hypothetical protein
MITITERQMSQAKYSLIQTTPDEGLGEFGLREFIELIGTPMVYVPDDGEPITVGPVVLIVSFPLFTDLILLTHARSREIEASIPNVVVEKRGFSYLGVTVLEARQFSAMGVVALVPDILA